MSDSSARLVAVSPHAGISDSGRDASSASDASDTSTSAATSSSATTSFDRVVQRWKLTRRQAEVLRHAVGGASNKEIAASLGIAEVTVELHMTALFTKTGAAGRGRLLALYWSKAATAT
jgi:DNA-binding NarL/FixJ family response regulator